MSSLETFISSKYRPDIHGSILDKYHKSRLYLSKSRAGKHSKKINGICFGPKKDNVLINLEHALIKEDDVIVLFYEDIHIRWTYVCNNHEMHFIYRQSDKEEFILRPSNLYIRSCYIDPNDKYWTILGEFFNFVDMWNGTVLCSPKKQSTNESKLYQLNNSLVLSAKKNPGISIGKSYVIKGARAYKLAKCGGAYIVKSLSGIRSVVVDDEHYLKWNTANINNIPVLFQEKIIGNDLRVHIINNKTFGKLSLTKDNIDYRYDKGFFNLLTVDKLESYLHDFCVDVAKAENNFLLGIDFIKTGIGYTVLEANPSPGWSAYHHCNGINVEDFISELIKVLKTK